MEDPSVSIIMATFNRGHLIKESLISIKNQTFRDWECIIIDDGSSDKTKEILMPFLKKDHRFKFLLRTKNYKKGISGCRNQGLDTARGKFIIFFDDDDIVHPENLETGMKFLKEGKFNYFKYEKQPFYGNEFMQSFDLEKDFQVKPINAQLLGDVVTGKLPFASCCVLWTEECFHSIRFSEDLLYAEEWECYSRILANGFKGVSVNKVLYYNRKHQNSNTGEFQQNSPVRMSSKVKAAEMILATLEKKQLLTPSIVQFFVRLGFTLKNWFLIKYTLELSNQGWFTKFKYRLGFIFYPYIRPILKLKGKLINY